MDLELLKVILQAVSSLALAGGVVYAAVQFRHSQKATHVANFAKLVELQMQLRRMRVEDPTLAEVYRHDVIDLRTQREVREHFFNLMQLSVFEIVWFSHRERQIPADYYRSWEARMRQIAAEPSFRRMMGGPTMKILHDDFQRAMLKMLEEVPALRDPSDSTVRAPDGP